MAFLDVTLRATQEMFLLSHPNFKKVQDTLNLLQTYPRAAQTAGIRGAPEVRRAVAGKYLVFYFYEENTDVVYILSVRHGARKPPTPKDLLEE